MPLFAQQFTVFQYDFECIFSTESHDDCKAAR